MTNHHHISPYPMLHRELVKSSTFFWAWRKQRAIKLGQEVILCWAGIQAKWSEMSVMEEFQQYSMRATLTALLAKAPTTLGTQVAWQLEISTFLVFKKKRNFMRESHILSSWPAFHWLLPSSFTFTKWEFIKGGRRRGKNKHFGRNYKAVFLKRARANCDLSVPDLRSIFLLLLLHYI